MIRIALTLLVLCSSMLGAGAGPLDSVARLAAVGTDIGYRTYPTYDADGQPAAAKLWKISTGTGNCCENYLTSTASGMLVNAGGGIRYSTDGGDSWTQVISGRPLSDEGEGAVAAAPGGDVVAVGWAPYDGDRLQSYKYEAATGVWRTSEVPLRVPFFDRPWIGVLDGPFTTPLGTVPYITVLRGGWPSKDVWMYSLDGLNYERAGNGPLEAIGLSQTGAFPVTADPELDWLQAHPASSVTTLSGGGLAFGTGRCIGQIASDTTWRCRSVPHEISGADRVLVDARGWIHAFHLFSSYLYYYLSTDGGESWTWKACVLPAGIENTGDFEARASSAAGIAAIALHATGAGGHQDLVVRWDITDADAEFLGTWLVGRGNFTFQSGITATGPRFDFTTMTLLPGGKIAMSFADASYRTPAIAISQD